jgi:hypothetical protein
MNLSPKIAVALDGPEVGALPTDISIEDGAHRLVLHLTASGPVGLAFSAFDFSTSARDEWPAQALKTWSDRIAARVTYLMEPLVVLEHDPIVGEVEIRSHAPTSRGDRRAYYEIRVGRAGTLRFARVAFDETTRRRGPIDCKMTREVLERLCDDIVACIP